MYKELERAQVASFNVMEDLERQRAELEVEVTERKRAEKQVKGALKEKEILLKEIHHRVKNNLQLISSLLRLQAAFFGGEHSSRLVRESEDRIRCMALIHE